MADLASTRVFGKLMVMHEAIVKANAEIVGNVTAAKFIGNGSGLTGTASLRATGTTKADVGLGNVGNYSSSTGTGGSTHALRDGSGDLHARLFRPTYTSLNTGTNVKYFWTSRATGTGDNYLRPTTFSEVQSLVLAGKAADSNLLDGINSSGFLRSNTTDYLTATTYVRGDIVVESGYRNRGYFGTHDSSKTQHIWSMGTAYRNNSAGTNFGNLYGLAYKHTNNGTGGSMAGGHMVVWCQNGSPKCALGNSIWTSGNVTAYSDARVKTNIEVIPDALDKVSSLNGYTFDRTDVTYDEHGIPETPVRQTGVIAQELLDVLPEAVTGGPTEDDPEGHYSVAYGNLVGLLIEAVKEERSKREALEDRLDRLEAMMEV